MSELETRELEYFIAVADELHFGRAASRLMIAQPALSKAIQRIETRLRGPLVGRAHRTPPRRADPGRAGAAGARAARAQRGQRRRPQCPPGRGRAGAAAAGAQ